MNGHNAVYIGDSRGIVPYRLRMVPAAQVVTSVDIDISFRALKARILMKANERLKLEGYLVYNSGKDGWTFRELSAHERMEAIMHAHDKKKGGANAKDTCKKVRSPSQRESHRNVSGEGPEAG